MRVAVDGRTLQSRPLGGVGRVLRGVLPELLRAGASVGLPLTGVDVLTDARLPAPTPVPSDAGADAAADAGSDVAGDVSLHPLRGPAVGRGPAWLQLAAPRWLRAHAAGGGVGLFHCPFYGLPFRQPMPMAASVYDLTFLDHRDWFPPATRAAFRVQARHAARTARVVITGSETVAAEITERLSVDADRIVVAPPGPDPVFLEAGARQTGRSGSATRERPYLVALGGAPRRNLPLTLAAWRRVHEKHPDVGLAVVGPLAASERVLVESAPGADAAGVVDDEDLARLLADALAFVYPTAYEGFGLPALEAAAAGTPVVCAPVGALPEVLGPAAQWCGENGAAPSTDDLAGAVIELLDDPARAERLAVLGRERASAAPTHADAARRWAAAYARALQP